MKALDNFSTYYDDFLDGTYDCIDRIVLNAYFIMAQSAGGFRIWWRNLTGGDDSLDNMHLMRLAGRFARRVRAYADKNRIPLIHCQREDRKHEIAQQYLPENPAFRGLFCILVGRAPGAVRDVRHYGNGGIDIHKKEPQPYINHYSFHIIDPDWGHITIIISLSYASSYSRILFAHHGGRTQGALTTGLAKTLVGRWKRGTVSVEAIVNGKP